jgi:hypothetical protein
VKTRIPTVAISRTLQAVATFGLVAPTTAIEATQSGTIARSSYLAEDGDAFGGTLSAISEEQDVSTAVNFPIAAVWDNAVERRFLTLVDREARNIATINEIEELEGLSDMRRRSELPRTGDEVLREYEQHQLIRNLLHSLTRYVEFIKNAPIEPSSTRPGAKAKA